MPQLHIKLEFIKQFVKAIDKAGEGFNLKINKLPCFRETKMKEGIFVGPQIRQLFNESIFMKQLKTSMSCI